MKIDVKIDVHRVHVIYLSQARRWLCALIFLVGAGCFLAGIVESDMDRRFLILAGLGLGLKVAAFVMAQRNRRLV